MVAAATLQSLVLSDGLTHLPPSEPCTQFELVHRVQRRPFGRWEQLLECNRYKARLPAGMKIRVAARAALFQFYSSNGEFDGIYYFYSGLFLKIGANFKQL
jgi:hypothetical protein